MTPRSLWPVAMEGDEGELVRRVQELLGVVPADGVFDRRLVVRVRGFQLSRGLHPSGALDVETLSRLGVPLGT